MDYLHSLNSKYNCSGTKSGDISNILVSYLTVKASKYEVDRAVTMRYGVGGLETYFRRT